MANFELTKEFIEELQLSIREESNEFITGQISELYPPDIAQILYELTGPEAHYIFQFLETEKGADVLSCIDSDDRKRFIKEQFTVEEIAKYVNLFDSDDAVDFLNEQPIDVREKVIALLEDREQARFILDMLH